MKHKILLVGVSGMVGHKMWQVFRQRFGADAVYGTVRKPRARYSQHPLFAEAGDHLIPDMDLLKPDIITPVLERLRPTVVVNCVALTFRKENSDSIEDNIRLNALLPHVLQRWCAPNGARLITLSTDCVFSGREGGYSETSRPDADDAYGRSKAMGEVTSGKALTIRTSIVGPEIEHKTQLLEWFLAQKGTIRGYRKTYFSGITTLYLSQLVGDIIADRPELQGLYHIASEPISKHDLLQEFRKAYGSNVEILPDDEKVSRKDLNGSKFEQATGVHVPSWPELVRAMRADGSLPIL